jgi:hypothetical protein
MMTLAFNVKEKERLVEVQAALIGVFIYAVAAIALWELSVVWVKRTKGDPPRSRRVVLRWRAKAATLCER